MLESVPREFLSTRCASKITSPTRAGNLNSVRHTFMHCRARLVALVGALAFSGLAHADAAPDHAIRIEPGPGQFTFVDAQGDAKKRMTIYTYLPAGLKADAAPIVFVMHGKGKDADGYRDSWAKHAKAHGFMVIAPLFDDATWRGAYAGNQVFTQGGKAVDASWWSFNVIEHLFDAIKAATGNRSATYFLYGHSEGGQFVHRLVWFLPEARYAKAVAANPGWYTMPDLAVAFPYGLAKSPATESSLKRSLERNLTVLLGDHDTDSDHAQLRKTPRALAQGRHRMERGQNFFKQASERCAALKCQFGWQMKFVPGAGHSNAQMAGDAAAVLMAGLNTRTEGSK